MPCVIKITLPYAAPITLGLKLTRNEWLFFGCSVIHFSPITSPSASINCNVEKKKKESNWNFRKKKITYRCPRRNGPNFGRVFLMLKYTNITQNTYIQSWTVTEIMAREVWNFDSCYILTDCQIHIETGRNMWFL